MTSIIEPKTIEFAYEIGTPVTYWSVIKESGERCFPFETQIASEPWQLGSGEMVCKVVGKSGGVSLKHLTPSKRGEFSNEDYGFDGNQIIDYEDALYWYARGVYDHLGLTISYEAIETRFQEYSQYVVRIIKSWCHDESVVFRLPDQGYVRIFGSDLSFYEKIKSLSVQDRIELMNLKEDDLLNHLHNKRHQKAKALEALMNQKWVDKVEDQPIDWDDAELNWHRFEQAHTGKKILMLLRRGNIKLESADQIITWLHRECKLVE